MDAMTTKIDVKHLYNPPAGDVVKVDLSSTRYLIIDGAHDLNPTLQPFASNGTLSKK